MDVQGKKAGRFKSACKVGIQRPTISNADWLRRSPRKERGYGGLNQSLWQLHHPTRRTKHNTAKLSGHQSWRSMEPEDTDTGVRDCCRHSRDYSKPCHGSSVLLCISRPAPRFSPIDRPVDPLQEKGTSRHSDRASYK